MSRKPFEENSPTMARFMVRAFQAVSGIFSDLSGIIKIKIKVALRTLEISAKFRGSVAYFVKGQSWYAPYGRQKNGLSTTCRIKTENWMKFQWDIRQCKFGIFFSVFATWTHRSVLADSPKIRSEICYKVSPGLLVSTSLLFRDLLNYQIW